MGNKKKVPPKKRNHKAERKAALARCVDDLADLRFARDEGWGRYAQTARALLLAGLPLQETDEKQIVREIRLGSEKLIVAFTAMDPHQVLPFGSDVNLLHFLMDRCLRQESPAVEWRCAVDYFDWIGMHRDSGKNTRDLRARWLRITGLGMFLRYIDERLPEDEQDYRTKAFAVIEDANLPPAIDRRRRTSQLRLPGFTYGVKLADYLWQDAQKHKVLVPLELIRKFKDAPMRLRLATFLGWRSMVAKSRSIVPWEAAQEAVGSRRVKRNFRSEAKKVLDEMHTYWPEINIEVDPLKRGLEVAPTNQPLLRLLPRA